MRARFDILHSVVLLEIDVKGVTSFEFESDAPRSVHMDRVASRVEARQQVKIVPRHVYLGDLDRFIDRIETNAYAPVHSLIDFGGPSGLEKIGQRPVLERLDHMICNRNVDDLSTIRLQS
jgi:hypothetical protein